MQRACSNLAALQIPKHRNYFLERAIHCVYVRNGTLCVLIVFRRRSHRRSPAPHLLDTTAYSSETFIYHHLIMPGLPKRQNLEGFDGYFEHHEADITSPLLPNKSPARVNMPSNIKYIAPQMDPLAGSSTRATRQSPVRLMLQDAGVLITMLPYLPYIFLPFKAKNPSDELYMDIKGARDAILQCWLFVIQSALLLVTPIAFLLLPGALSIAAVALCCLTVYLVSWPMEGPSVTYSNMDDATGALAEKHRDERWIFVNGTATG